MNTEELLEELKKKLERLSKLEAAFEGTGGSTSAGKKRKARKPMSQETKDKIAAGRKAAWAAKKKKAKG
jgi:hypothetical protein